MTLLVVGANSSGKSSCARYLASALDGTIVEFGDLVRLEISADPSLARDPSRAYEQLVCRHESGLLARWAKAVMAESGTQTFIMVGVRDEPSYRKLLYEFPAAIRIAVVADPIARRARDALKQANVSPSSILSPKEFAKRDAVHRGWGLDRIIREADYTVFNNGSSDAFYEELRLLLPRLIGRHHAKTIQCI